MIFYDFEVFEYDWLVVLFDSKTKSEKVIINDNEKLENFYQENKFDIWVGFNNKNYDQHILKGILCGFNPKKISDYIITDHNNGWGYSNLMNKIYTIQYDVMNSLNKGLKTYEGFQGKNIKESDVAFNIPRKLTEEEIKETIIYCRSDVINTYELFIKTIKDFKAHMNLVKMSGGNLKYLSKTKTQLSSIILQAKQTIRDDEFDVFVPDNLEIKKYKKIVDWYKSDDSKRYYNRVKKKNGGYKNEENRLEICVAGVDHVFGWGGLHGARKKYHSKGYFILMDVSSLYPSLMIKYNLLSRSCSRNGVKKYEEIYHKRLELKSLGKKEEQAPLKLVLNSTYGAAKDKFNALLDPRNANLVCLFGQLFLLDLIEHLENDSEIIQSNTDGILIKVNPKNFEKIDDIAYEWEKRTGLNLTFDQYKEVFQKDVNNYLLVDLDNEVKAKGAYVKELNSLDYDLPIINKALRNYMIDKTPVEETILSCNKLYEFQMVTKISSKYDYALWGSKKLKERVIRSFASTNKNHGDLRKKHSETGSYEKLSLTSEHNFIDNGDIKNIKVPEFLDKNYYINLAKKRLEDFGVI
ncbi:hypothetical protein [Anaerococcus vaginalis]|uniref:hypothetical protein n=1 Tax=Anaerococcus vaginalis TaxID=33037 RepID=UPI0029135C98|nr:hypothetical protein [Anaerococcus vaginalis]MDU5824049.1 hypothetical protein [Anaerococcus vaginalis]MDU7141396.1 hypothetical protein [Anaerococcus vaginalis]